MSTVTEQPTAQTGGNVDLELLGRYYDLPVCNSGHALEFQRVSRQLVALCQSQGLHPDGEVIDRVALGHDVDKPLPLDRRIYPKAENRSADITFSHELSLRKRKDIEPRLYLPYRKIFAVVNGILGTHHAEPVTTLEGIIENRADVDNTGQNYEARMAPVSVGLLVEKRHLASGPVTFERWHKEAMMILGGFIAKNLFLGDFDVNEKGIPWISTQAANYERFCGETEDSLREIVGRNRCAALESRYPATVGWQKFHLMTPSV